MPGRRFSDPNHSVFLNCPFENIYKPLFDAIIFAIHDCDFIVRCALEAKDSAQVRYRKSRDLIKACRYGLHDISRTELDRRNHLPRFNMPLELGLFLGAKEFGDRQAKSKVCLVLDKKPRRYQKFCSDLAGVDIEAHKNRPQLAIKIVRLPLFG